MDDEKQRLATADNTPHYHDPSATPAAMPAPRVFRRPRPTVALLVLAAIVCSVWTWTMAPYRLGPANTASSFLFPDSRTQEHLAGDDSGADAHAASAGSRLVPLEAHIMSKCNDATVCLHDMILPVMQRAYNKVNFTLSFIGVPTNDDGVDCRHGPGECMGNILELCAFELYPDPKISLGFTMCLMRDYEQIPERELVEECALEHAVDFQALDECATRDDGGHGMGMLRDSVRRTTKGVFFTNVLDIHNTRPASQRVAP